MKKVFIVAMALAGVMAATAGRLTVVDDSGSSGVIGATVFSSAGIILGVTDADGAIDIVDDRAYPLSIRALGYSTVSIAATSDTVKLSPEAFELAEVTVNPVDRPVTRVVSFVREYSTGTTGGDTLQLYSEYMAEAFLADKGVKGYKDFDSRQRTRAVARVLRIHDASGKDSITTRIENDEDFLAFAEFIVSLPSKPIKKTDAIFAGATADTVQGKYFPATVYRRSGNMLFRQDDLLSSQKKHSLSPWLFKLLGFTMDFDEMRSSAAYRDNGGDSYGVGDLVYGTYSLHVGCRGKWIKKLFKTREPVEINSYVEVYPVEISFHTVDEYKEMKEDYTRIDFVIPDNVLPLHPAVEALRNAATGQMADGGEDK